LLGDRKKENVDMDDDIDEYVEGGEESDS